MGFLQDLDKQIMAQQAVKQAKRAAAAKAQATAEAEKRRAAERQVEHDEEGFI